MKGAAGAVANMVNLPKLARAGSQTGAFLAQKGIGKGTAALAKALVRSLEFWRQPDAQSAGASFVAFATIALSAAEGGESAAAGAVPNPGGALGSEMTRAQDAAIRAVLEDRGWTVTNGGGLVQEHIPGPNGGMLGSMRPDLTAEKAIAGVVDTMKM